MALNIFGNGIWGGGQSNPPTTNTTPIMPGQIVTGTSGTNMQSVGGTGGGGGNWSIGGIGQATPQFTNSQPIKTHLKCERCGYKDNEYSDKYCILCNEEL